MYGDFILLKYKQQILNIMETNKLKSLIQYLPGFLILMYVFFLAITQFIK